MKKVSTQTTSFLSIIMIAFLAIFAIGELVFCLISPNTVLGWLQAAHTAYYSASTAVAPKMTAFILEKSFQNLFSVSYIRVMSMYIFVLCIPLIYGLINIYFISQNGSSGKPFKASTNACLRTISISFMAEVAFASVLYLILKLVMKTLPFYFMYTMVAVAIYSLSMIVFASTISGLINRMGDLRNERAKQIQKEKVQRARPAGDEEIRLEAPEAPAKKFTASTDFDDVLNTLEEE